MALNFSKEKQHRQKFGTAIDMDSPESYSVSKKNDNILNIDEWVRQILFWRTHLDVFLEDVFSDDENIVRFYPFQAIKLRQIGNCSYVIDDESRGLGKTFICAWAAFGLAVLYPTNKIYCISNSGRQATLILRNIERFYKRYKNVRREIIEIKIGKDEGSIVLKNGSTIEARPAGKKGDSIRGERTKVVFIDEGLLIKSAPINDAIKPTGAYIRDAVTQLRLKGFKEYEDVESKIIEMSSAYYKYVDHFDRFKKTFSEMIAGEPSFCCAIPYNIGLYHNIFPKSVIDEAKRNNTKESFMMEYDCRHIGTFGDGVYSYELVMENRTAETVELKQVERKTRARYIISADIATSSRAGSDNAVISVIKFSERKDGTFFKRLVFIRSYNGKDLKELAMEIRRLCVDFPSIEKVIVDVNGLGEGVVSFLELPYVDERDGKEYPPFVSDDMDCSNIDAIPIVYSYRGSNEMNNRGTMALKMFLENHTLTLPTSWLKVKDSVGEDLSRSSRIEEAAVFKDADALMFELTNIRAYTTANSVKYGVRKGLHKDRYSSLMMACYYLYELENINKKQQYRTRGDRKSYATILHI